MLGERVHPNTGRLMGYVACEVRSGTAYVADAEELADLVWAAPDQLTDYILYGFAPIVQDYLTVTLQ
ncbi:hypothetical protein C8K30_104449 [Promicromonospora sp. AC04]|nr:hypothetical protein C8K30_104449 [Promicromonospora sp. AC04]